MAEEDTKKVVVPVDKEENGLDRPFPPPTFDYDTVPDPSQEQADDLPYETQPVVNGVQPVSIEGTRNTVLNNARRLNRTSPDDTQSANSTTGFTPDRGRLNFPDNSTQSADLRLGDLFGNALPGRRRPNNQVTLQDTFKKIDEQTQGDGDVPHQRSVFNAPTYGQKSNTDNDLTNRIQNSVLSQNRFSVISDNNPDVFHGPDDSNIDRQEYTVFQEALGAYDKANTPLTLEKMAFVAESIMKAAFQGTGQVPDADLSEISSEDFIRKAFDDFRAKESQAVPSIGKGSTGAFNESGTEESFGNMNSPSVPFDALTPDSLAKLALSQIAATIALTAENFALDVIIDGVSNADPAPVGPPYTMGSFSTKRIHGRDLAQGVRQRFGIVKTANNYEDAVIAGIKTFFGAPQSTELKNLDKAGENRIKQSPGYYYIFSRAIARSAQDIASRTGSENIRESTPGPDGVDGILSLYKNSKIVGAINVFASIGDATLKDAEGAFDIDRVRTDTTTGIGSDLPIAASIKSRRAPDDLRLAWRGSSTPSMFLLPPSVEFANTFSGQTGMISAAHAGLESRTISKVGKKLSKVQAARHEKRLDAEYVPFYFKDLRTNEIVSFHAFLSTLTDQYNASYSRNNSIGRADPIRIYQNTDRSINFTFNLVATSREDFDEMWFKINKLTTLLYPQYTKGRKVATPDGRTQFIMPFSQVMSASPMIRLRIGDVIRSNYSKFNLSRLFGLGTPDFLPGSISADAAQTALKTLLTRNDVVVSFGTAEFDQGFLDLPTVLGVLVRRARIRPTSGGLTGVGAMAGDVVRIPYPAVRSLPREDGQGNFQLPFKDVYALITERREENGTIKYVGRLRGTPDALSAAPLNVPGESIMGAECIIEHDQIQVFPEGLILIKAAILAAKASVGVINLGDISSVAAGFDAGFGIGGKYSFRVNEFLKSKNNSVVKSFEEAGGKGLAGFIDSMNFTWIDGATNWEVEKDARAPKTAQITMRFLPVHDISPGLDHTGYNRAANYPVGDPSNRVAGTRQVGGAAEVFEAVSDDKMNALDLLRFAADSNYISDTVEIAAKRNGGDVGLLDVALRNLY
jgi:hypothetical protein